MYRTTRKRQRKHTHKRCRGGSLSTHNHPPVVGGVAALCDPLSGTPTRFHVEHTRHQRRFRYDAATRAYVPSNRGIVFHRVEDVAAVWDRYAWLSDVCLLLSTGEVVRSPTPPKSYLHWLNTRVPTLVPNDVRFTHQGHTYVSGTAVPTALDEYGTFTGTWPPSEETQRNLRGDVDGRKRRQHRLPLPTVKIARASTYGPVLQVAVWDALVDATGAHSTTDRCQLWKTMWDPDKHTVRHWCKPLAHAHTFCMSEQGVLYPRHSAREGTLVATGQWRLVDPRSTSADGRKNRARLRKAVKPVAQAFDAQRTTYVPNPTDVEDVEDKYEVGDVYDEATLMAFVKQQLASKRRDDARSQPLPKEQEEQGWGAATPTRSWENDTLSAYLEAMVAGMGYHEGVPYEHPEKDSLGHRNPWQFMALMLARGRVYE